MSPTGAFIRPFRLFNGAKRSSHKCNHPTTVRPNVCLSLVTFNHTCFCELPNHWHWHCEFKCVCASLLTKYYFVSVLPCFLRSGTFWDPIVITRRTYENVYFFGGRGKKKKKKNTLTSSPKCFMAYSSTPEAASGCCSLLLMLEDKNKVQLFSPKGTQTKVDSSRGDLLFNMWRTCGYCWYQQADGCLF